MLKDKAMSNHVTGNNNTVAGRDVNITNIYHKEGAPFPRTRLVAEILALRNRSAHLEFVINTHADKCYGSHYFKEMKETELQAMHEFACHLRDLLAEQQPPGLVKQLLLWIKGAKRTSR